VPGSVIAPRPGVVARLGQSRAGTPASEAAVARAGSLWLAFAGASISAVIPRSMTPESELSEASAIPYR
jgi:hypothetical protein